jgi:hypothetical protein
LESRLPPTCIPAFSRLGKFVPCVRYRAVYRVVVVAERLVLGLRADAEVVRAVDAARGVMTRSDWLERAVLAFLEAGAVIPSVSEDPVRAAELRDAIRGSAETVARLEAARNRPLPARCSHRRRGAYCVSCRCLVDPDGWPVRAP